MESSEQEKRISVLEADVRALEEAADASLAERALLRRDLDVVTEILTKFITMQTARQRRPRK